MAPCQLGLSHPALPITRSPAPILDTGVSLLWILAQCPSQVTEGVGSGPVSRAVIFSAVGHWVLVEKSPCSILGSREKSLALPVHSVPCHGPHLAAALCS